MVVIMCGLTGFLTSETLPEAPTDVAARMAETLAARGPDDSGVWSDDTAGIALGHRRLAVIDLSPEGRQPMHSACGRYVLAFNGEVYNHRALRQELEGLGHGFRGHSDTEVMLAGIAQWGLEVAVSRFNGMFAFALWDRRERRLSLVRDRIGIKPLYYGWAGRGVVFGSELKAIRAFPAFRAEIDPDAVALLMRYRYIPAPHSIYRGIYKLLPGTILTVTEGAGRRDFSPYAHASSATRPVPYWSAREIAEGGVADPFEGDESEAVAQLDALLRDAVGLRMVADVPLGAFLSGGIDSSAVVALMQAQSSRPVRTFTIGFSEAAYDEAAYARAVAAHLGTDHTELYVTTEEARAVLPALPTLYDEPFADSSQIPTFLVSRLTRRHVTVSLSGDGGDELFAGYDRYRASQLLWQAFGWMPGLLRRPASGMLRRLPTAFWNRAFRWGAPLVGGSGGQISDRFYKLPEVIGAEDREALYRGVISHWEGVSRLVTGAQEMPTALTNALQWADLPDFYQWMMYLDLISYLPDDILTKVDRASMGVSLEARVPLLDHRVVAFAWRIPMSMKRRNGYGKWLLRQVLYRYVPEELVERPKMGFAVPIGAWLSGPLREWAEALLDEGRLHREGYLAPEPVQQRWREHLSGKRDWQHYLWDVLTFQAWLEQANRRINE